MGVGKGIEAPDPVSAGVGVALAGSGVDVACADGCVDVGAGLRVEIDVGPAVTAAADAGVTPGVSAAPVVGIRVTVVGEVFPLAVGRGVASGLSGSPSPEISKAKRVATTARLAAAPPAMNQTRRDLTLTLPPQVGQKGWVSGTRCRFTHLVGFIGRYSRLRSGCTPPRTSAG